MDKLNPNAPLVAAAVADHSDGVFRLIRRIVGDRDTALDLTQDVFVMITERFDALRDPEQLKAYLFRSAFNRALNHRRDRARREGKTEDIKASTYSDGPSRPDEIVETMESRRGVRDAVDRLAEKQREAISLKFYAGLTSREIARVMRIAEGSVKVHLARGLRNLKTILAETAERGEL